MLQNNVLLVADDVEYVQQLKSNLNESFDVNACHNYNDVQIALKNKGINACIFKLQASAFANWDLLNKITENYPLLKVICTVAEQDIDLIRQVINNKHIWHVLIEPFQSVEIKKLLVDTYLLKAEGGQKVDTANDVNKHCSNYSASAENCKHQIKNDLFAGLMEYAEKPVAFKGLNNRFLYVNETFASFVGYDASFIIGKRSLDFFDQQEVIPFLELDDDIIQSKKAIHSSFIGVLSNRKAQIKVTKFPVVDKDNKVYAIGLIVTDISKGSEQEASEPDVITTFTGGKQMRSKLLNTLNEAFVLNQKKDHFIRDIVVELNSCSLPANVYKTSLGGLVSFLEAEVGYVLPYENGKVVISERISERNLAKENKTALFDLLTEQETTDFVSKVIENEIYHINDDELNIKYHIDSIIAFTIKQEDQVKAIGIILNKEGSKREFVYEVLGQIKTQVSLVLNRIAMQLHLKASEEKFREFADLLPLAAFEMDLEGTITYVNKRGLEWSEYSELDLKRGTSIFELIDNESKSRLQTNMQRRIMNDFVESSEYTLIPKSGKVDNAKLASLSSAVILKDGVPVGIRAVAIDITKQKENEKELKEFNQTMINRELRMIELKEEVNQLKIQLGESIAYKPIWND